MQKKNEAYAKIGYSSIAKVRQILDCFSFTKPSLTAAQIASRVDMPTSSLYRYLQALVSAKFLAHDAADNSYSIGMYMIELAGMSLMQYEIRYAAMSVINSLSTRLSKNVNLSVLDGCDIFHLAYAIHYYSTPWVDAIGRRTPAYLTAMGGVMLAYKPFDEVREMILQHHDSDPATYPLPDFARLQQDFETVRKTQLLLLHNKYPSSQESYCLASPIRARGGKICGAISVNWYREPDVDLPDVIARSTKEAMVQSAARISYKLGYIGNAYQTAI